MITLTDAARKELEAFFSAHTDTPKSIRVFFAPGGWSGPTASMALDEPDNQDMTEVIGEITFCMAKDLYDRIGAVTIDLGYMGFQILTERPYQDASAGGCSSGGCSGSCSGGSCSI